MKRGEFGDEECPEGCKLFCERRFIASHLDQDCRIIKQRRREEELREEQRKLEVCVPFFYFIFLVLTYIHIHTYVFIFMKEQRQREQQRLRELAEFFLHVNPREEQVVKLNVGGVLLTTSANTLRKYPDSLLAILFAEGNKPNCDSSGCVFLDRNGRIFSYVLDWMRR